LSVRLTVRIFGLILFTSLLLAYFFYFDNWDFTPLKAISYELLLLLALIHVVSLLFHTLAVWIFLRRIQPSSSFSSVYLALTASSSVGYLLPGKLGLPVRVYLYRCLFGLTVAVSFGVVAWDLYRCLFGLTVAVSFGVVAWELAVTTFFPLIFSIPALWIFYADPWLFALVSFLIFLLLSLILAGYFLWRYGDEINWLSKLRSLFFRVFPFAEGMGQTRKPLNFWTLASFSFLCLLVLFCSVFFSQVLLIHLGSPVSFLTLLSIQSLSYLVGLISLMPMGLGARELSLVVLLGGAGVPADVATYAALIQRVVATGLSFLLGLISLQVLGLRGNLVRIKEIQKAYGEGK